MNLALYLSRVRSSEVLDRIWLPDRLDEVVELALPTVPCRRVITAAAAKVQRMRCAASTAPIAFVQRKRVHVVEAIKVYEESLRWLTSTSEGPSR
jgi:hypothetical protein